MKKLYAMLAALALTLVLLAVDSANLFGSSCPPYDGATPRTYNGGTYEVVSGTNPTCGGGTGFYWYGSINGGDTVEGGPHTSRDAAKAAGEEWASEGNCECWYTLGGEGD